ncbi:unnamed protein product [Prorocentrum cordatum]|uniref:Secreted protein n=1 Tax=Prorocentrum cordatum TaxID=2364126 RepID=A0ABN9QV30_9DINO|nr:unnamed protein product [Polarella glacialis]
MLLLFVVLELLAECPPPPECSFEEFRGWLRSDEGLGRLGANGPASVLEAAGNARAFMETTPVSTAFALAPSADHARHSKAPVCVVAADEVLHHCYEKPPGGWRLLVVDARMRQSAASLPVCLRLCQDQTHAQRRKVLRDLPYDESIHLCLMPKSPRRPATTPSSCAATWPGPR